jgi:hypothetical protein
VLFRSIEEKYLADIEWRDNIFSHIDYKVFSTGAQERAARAG